MPSVLPNLGRLAAAMLGLQELKKVCYDDRPTDPLLGILALLDRLNRTGIDLLPGLKEML